METLPDKVVQNTIQAGLAALAADTDLIDDLFSGYDAATIAYIKTFFSTHTNIKVRLGYPRPDTSFPAVNVVLSNESENTSADALGDHLGEEFDTDTEGLDIVRDVKGYAQNIQLTVLVVSNNEDATPFLYQVVKRILLAAKLPLESIGGLVNMTVSGSDFRFDPEYFPEFAYTRALTLSATSFFRMVSETPEYIAKSFQLFLYPSGEQRYVDRIAHTATLRRQA